MTELERPIRLDTLGEGARAMTIEADAAERAALATRFGLVALEKLEAFAEISRLGDAVLAEGRVTARVVQACVATGADVSAAINEPFVLHFVPEAVAGEEIELGEGQLDEISYTGGAIDLGEAVAQTLALALDPFPRAPDADARLRAAGVVPEEEAGTPSGLKGLRDLLGQ